jgi:hypothetical protein
MSALGQKRTHALQQKSGIGRHDPGRFYSGKDGFFLVFRDDCFGSQADITPNAAGCYRRSRVSNFAQTPPTQAANQWRKRGTEDSIDHAEKADDGHCAACGRCFISSGTERPHDWRPTASRIWWRGRQCRYARPRSISGSNYSSSRNTTAQNVHDLGKPHPQRFKIDARQ